MRIDAMAMVVIMVASFLIDTSIARGGGHHGGDGGGDNHGSGGPRPTFIGISFSPKEIWIICLVAVFFVCILYYCLRKIICCYLRKPKPTI